jgi:hypothetical protein
MSEGGGRGPIRTNAIKGNNCTDRDAGPNFT